MTLGIIGAMQVEIENLKPSIKGATFETISGIEFMIGEIDGVKVIAAVSGVGKVLLPSALKLWCYTSEWIMLLT